MILLFANHNNNCTMSQRRGSNESSLGCISIENRSVTLDTYFLHFYVTHTHSLLVDLKVDKTCVLYIHTKKHTYCQLVEEVTANCLPIK